MTAGSWYAHLQYNDVTVAMPTDISRCYDDCAGQQNPLHATARPGKKDRGLAITYMHMIHMIRIAAALEDISTPIRNWCLNLVGKLL